MHVVAIKFKLVAVVVDQPLRSGLVELASKQCFKVLPADSFAKSCRACLAPRAALHLVGGQQEFMPLGASPFQLSIGTRIFLREAFATSGVCPFIHIIDGAIFSGARRAPGAFPIFSRHDASRHCIPSVTVLALPFQLGPIVGVSFGKALATFARCKILHLLQCE